MQGLYSKGQCLRLSLWYIVIALSLSFKFLQMCFVEQTMWEYGMNRKSPSMLQKPLNLRILYAVHLNFTLTQYYIFHNISDYTIECCFHLKKKTELKINLTYNNTKTSSKKKLINLYIKKWFQVAAGWERAQMLSAITVSILAILII